MIMSLKARATADTNRLDAGPAHVNPVLWNQSLGYSRQACARIFRDGGQPVDALTAFGIQGAQIKDWSKAVELVAESLTRAPVRRAA